MATAPEQGAGSAPALDIQAAAAAFDQGNSLMPEAPPFSSGNNFDPAQDAMMASVFGLEVPGAGPPGQGADGSGTGAASPTPAAGAGTGGQATQNGSPVPSPQPAGGQAPSPQQPQQGQPQPQPLPPVAAPLPSVVPPQPPVPAAQPAPQLPTPDPRDLELASLRAQVQQLVAASQQAPQPQGGQQPQQGQGQPDGIPPLQVPPQLIQHMVDRDGNLDANAAAQAMTHMLNQAMQHVHSQIMERVPTLIDSRTNELQSRIQSDRTAEQARNDYYASFPQHQNPAVQAIVAQELASLQQQYPGAPWSESYRNALGQRVNAAIAQLTGQPTQPGLVPQAPQPTTPVVIGPQPQALPQAAPMLPQGSRPPGMGQPDPGQFMLDTFGGGFN